MNVGAGLVIIIQKIGEDYFSRLDIKGDDYRSQLATTGHYPVALLYTLCTSKTTTHPVHITSKTTLQSTLCTQETPLPNGRERHSRHRKDQKSHLIRCPKKSLNWVPIREFQSQCADWFQLSNFSHDPDPGLIEMFANHAGRFNQGASSSLTKCSNPPNKT